MSRLVTDHKLEWLKPSLLGKLAKTRGLPCAAKVDDEGRVPDDALVEVLKEIVEDCKATGCVVDGLPSTGAQAEAMAASGMAVDKLVVCDVTEEELLAFHASRFKDPETGNLYDSSNPAPDDAKDRLVQLENDQEDKVKERIAPYFAELPKIRPAFGAKKVINIKGTTSKGEAEDAMYTEVCAIIGLS